MKKKYFKFIEIENSVVLDFLNKHPDLKRFINPNTPFYVRVSLKPYPALIHNILWQDENDLQANQSTAMLASILDGKIDAKRVNKLSDQQLLQITPNQTKINLIKIITSDVVSKKLNLKKLHKLPTQEITNILSSYQGLTLATIKQFELFSCFKQDILCDTDPDFIEGLKIYLNKQDIIKQDIINIEQQFSGQYTLFSLCMWRIKNERNKK